MANTTKRETFVDAHIEQLNPSRSNDWVNGIQKRDDDLQHAQRLAENYDPNSEEERKLVRKLDWRLVPSCWTMYLMSNLDRANIGNAKIGGLEQDFQLTSTQYSIIVLVFFISYLLCEVPSNMLLNRVRPSMYLPGLGILWGIAATCMGAAQNWHQLVAMRFLLGIFEAGFAPGCAFYLSSWYKKYELASRYAWLYTSVAVAGAISGLLAGVITEYMEEHSWMEMAIRQFASTPTPCPLLSLLVSATLIACPKQILEGLGSIIAALVVYFVMPDYPTTTKSRFLTEEERMLACNRLAIEGIGLTQGAHSKVSEWNAFKMTVHDWRTWALCLLFVLTTGSQTMQYFVPSLVKTFGWEGNTAQYYTIPSYAFAVVCILAACPMADKYKTIWPILAGLAGVGFAFFVAVTAISDGMTRYGLAIFAFGTIYGCSPLTKTWISHVLSHPAEKRAVAIALINALGNASSIYGSFLWPKAHAPKYLVGFGTTTSWMGALSLMTVVFAYLFRKYPVKAPDHEKVMASQLRAEREGRQVNS